LIDIAQFGDDRQGTSETRR